MTALNICLVAPKEYQSGGQQQFPMLGILYLATFLKQKGFQVDVWDFFLNDRTDEEFYFHLQKTVPRIVGVSFNTENRLAAKKMIAKIRGILPKAFIVAGGPHPTLACENTMNGVPELDAVVIGEGEDALQEIAECLASGGGSLDGVAGLALRKDDGTVFRTLPRMMRKDLDEYPYPDRSFVQWTENSYMNIPNHGKVLTAHVMGSRGCPFSCNFCSENLFWSRRFRYRSPENVVGELLALKEQFGVGAVFFYDSVFNLKRDRTVELCRLMIEKRLNLHWRALVRIDLLDEELMALMREAGCYALSLGVESGSEQVREEIIGKTISNERLDEVIEQCKKLGIVPELFLILGNPKETFEDVMKSLRLLDKVSGISRQMGVGDNYGVGVLKLYPGTRLFERAVKERYVDADHDWMREGMFTKLFLKRFFSSVPVYRDRSSISLFEYWLALFKYYRMSNQSIIKRLIG